MLWLVLLLAAIGAAFYIVDKKIKEKYKPDDKFNPDDWGIPAALAAPVEPKPQASIMAPVVSDKINFTKKKCVLTPEYEKFFSALQTAVANQYSILTNINAADVLDVLSAGNTLSAQVATKNMASKQFDFILCEKETLTAVCIMVLDEPLPAFLSNACESANLPVVQIRAQISYDAQMLRENILHVLEQSNNKTSTALNQTKANTLSDPLEIISTEPEVTPSEKAIETQVETAESGIELKFCPNCSAVMLKRKAKNGASAGKMFWLCSTYPKCRGMLPL